MPKRSLALLLAWFWVCAPAHPRQDPASCGTHAEKASEQLFVHRQRPRSRLMALTAPARSRDVGDVAVIEDSGDIVARNIPFNLDQKTITFLPQTPAAASYRFQTGSASYDQAAATAGLPLSRLGDDDARQISLPFSFPFYGKSYQQLFVNSDGNLTFDSAEYSTSERSLGRMVAGPPRISPLFRDLDPSSSSQGVRVDSRPERVVVSWVEVPEFTQYGTGLGQTFQVRLFPDGRIELAYAGVSSTDAVVGISPGGRLGTTALVSFTDTSADDYSGTLAQRFSSLSEVDIFEAAVKFYETHEDAYDYLVLFNNMGVMAAPGAVAYEVTARNLYRNGYGDKSKDIGALFGSPRRLQSVMNMGSLGQYPLDPDALVPGRGYQTGDTSMTLLGHEAGHLFLAFASVRDPNDPAARPMLQHDGAHWSFNFNSDASLLEGNRIRDNGDGSFTTIATVQGYSALDQYLMGLLPQEEVPPTFLVTGSTFPSSYPPSSGRTFRGDRRDIRVEEIVHAEGLRAPGPAVSQRHFRFAFILIVPAGTDPRPEELAQLETYRSRFPDYYSRYAGGRAWAETSLRRSLRLSVAPAAGVLAGRVFSGTVSIERPSSEPLTVEMKSLPEAAFLPVPSSVTIAAGATSAEFQIAGLRPGADDLVASPSDQLMETVYARILVAAAPSELHLAVVSGQGQIATPGVPMPSPVVLRVTDADNLPYAGLLVRAYCFGGGSVLPRQATSDEDGLVRLQWTPGPGPLQELRAYLEDAPASSAVSVLGLTPPRFGAQDVVNAASYADGLSPGALASIFGFGLSAGVTAIAPLPYPALLDDVSVLLNGKPAQLQYISERLINFVVPADLQPGPVSLVVATPVGSSPPVSVQVLAASPGIFFDVLTGNGAVVRNGDHLEVYCTGLGTGLPVKAYLGGVEVTPSFSGPNSVFPGLFQVNVRLPAALAGDETLAIEVNGRRSNEVKVRL